MKTRQRCNYRARLTELLRWELDAGRDLPYSPGYILAVEDRGGWVDLVTGFVFLPGATTVTRWAPTAKARGGASWTIGRGRGTAPGFMWRSWWALSVWWGSWLRWPGEG